MSLSDGPPLGFIPLTDTPNYSGYPSNSYLTYRPIFARSLPIQILFTGVTLTLGCVLLVQLTSLLPTISVSHG